MACERCPQCGQRLDLGDLVELSSLLQDARARAQFGKARLDEEVTVPWLARMICLIDAVVDRRNRESRDSAKPEGCSSGE